VAVLWLSPLPSLFLTAGSRKSQASFSLLMRIVKLSGPPPPPPPPPHPGQQYFLPFFLFSPVTGGERRGLLFFLI